MSTQAVLSDVVVEHRKHLNGSIPQFATRGSSVANGSKLNIPAVTLPRPSAACDRNAADGRDPGNLQLRSDL
jgi:hypothetical protein